MAFLDSLAHMMMDNGKLHYNNAVFSSLNAEEKWLITLSGPLSAFNGDYLNSIETGKHDDHIRSGVTEVWGVTDRQDFEDTVEHLVNTGQRKKFELTWKFILQIEELREKAPIWMTLLNNLLPVFMPYYIKSRLDVQSIKQQTGYNEEEFIEKFPNIESNETWVHDLEKEFAKKKSFSKPVKAVSSLLAWDAVRLVSLTRWAVQLGYIRRNEFLHFATQLTDEVKATYKSWEEISAAYIVAGVIWSNSSGRMENLLRTNRLLLNKSDSPYKTVPF